MPEAAATGPNGKVSACVSWKSKSPSNSRIFIEDRFCLFGEHAEIGVPKKAMKEEGDVKALERYLMLCRTSTLHGFVRAECTFKPLINKTSDNLARKTAAISFRNGQREKPS